VPIFASPDAQEAYAAALKQAIIQEPLDKTKGGQVVGFLSDKELRYRYGCDLHT